MKCDQCGEDIKYADDGLCARCLELQKMMDLMESDERAYFWNNRPRSKLPPFWWMLVVACILIWGIIVWRFIA